jgi:hypothetical protein
VPSEKPSSIVPSQSLSSASQSSVVGVPAVALHCVPVPPALHTTTPARPHAPTPTEHAVPRPAKPSSVRPSQSSST